MTNERASEGDSNVGDNRQVPTDRKSPVGTPVIRGDESITGSHAERAVLFDPTNRESLAAAAETVRQFAAGTDGDDHLYMLRGAAACGALVRGEGSYKAAAERASAPAAGTHQGTETETVTVSVPFIRKWARVHDLPRSVRRQVALGVIAPSAAKHIARVSGESRLLLAWATIDGDMSVREVRTVASAINDGVPLEHALTEQGVRLGRLEVTLPPDQYRDLRRDASLKGVDPGDIVARALESYFS